MLKLIDIDSSFFNEEPVVRILDVGNAAGKLTKVAADSRITSFVGDLKPESGKIYVHILAMGAGEYFGANRNADYFPEENLIRWHDTFRTSPAHIFKHHINKNPEIAIGKVIYSVYNERMHRVEVIAWIDTQKGWDVVDKIERGEFPATSMACHTPFDTCSICGNKARSRNEYCVHLRSELGRVHADGTKTMAINDGPLKFFDMSVVFKPADVTSSVLQKVAYENSRTKSRDYGPVLGSAESAFMQGLTEKSAEIKKLSALIKEVEGTMVNSSDTMRGLLAKVKDPEEDIIAMLEDFELDHVIHALADLGISPSIGFFAKLIGRKICGESVNGIERLVQGLIQEDPGKIPVSEMAMTKSANDAGVFQAKKILYPMLKQSSLFPEIIAQRGLGNYSYSQAYEPEEFSDTHNVGYIGNGPHVAPDPRQSYRQLRDVYREKSDDGHGLLKTLFTIGGAAIAAKWLISRLIESKMQEMREEMRRENSGPVKIVLVKSAQQAFTTQQLVKASLIHSLKTGY
jgi:hypothetical protein